MTTKVTNGLLATNAVGTSQLQDDAVTQDKIADDAVGSAQLANNAVGSAELQTGAVTTAKIGDDQVTRAKLADNSVGTEQIVDGSIIAGKLAVGSVSQENLNAGSVGSSQIADGTLMSSHFNDGVVITAALADGAVVASKVADGSLTLTKLASGPNNAILVRNGSGVAVNLAPGLDGYVLSMVNGAPTWSSQILPTGIISDYFGIGAPSGWINANGETIGDPNSEATGLADTICQPLFMHLWNSFNNTICPVSGGRGASAIADWDAHKTIRLPDLRGRTTFGYESIPLETSGRITSASVTGDLSTVGLTGGSEKHALTADEMPPHYHYQFVNHFFDNEYPLPNGNLNGVVGFNPNSVPVLGWRHLISPGVYSYGGVLFLENWIEAGYGQTSFAGGVMNNVNVYEVVAHPQMPPMMLVSKIIKL